MSLYRGTFVGSGGMPVSGGTFSAAAPGAASQIVNVAGDWTTLGPNVFEGEIDIFSSNPVLQLSMLLEGNGVLDFANTGSVSLILPRETSFTSASTVFLTGLQTAVPEPANILLMVIGLVGVTGLAARCDRGSPKSADVELPQ